MIKEKNPYVVIYADNVYNPYVAVNYIYGPIEVLNLSELTEPISVGSMKRFTVPQKSIPSSMPILFFKKTDIQM